MPIINNHDNFRGYGKSSGTPTHLNVAKDGQIF
jgi:hypothetical protein